MEKNMFLQINST